MANLYFRRPTLLVKRNSNYKIISLIAKDFSIPATRVPNERVLAGNIISNK